MSTHVYDCLRFVVQLVVSSDTHSIALCQNGEIFSWGDGFRGQHGFGAQRPQLAPKILSVGLKRIKSITCGASFTVAVTTQGMLWSWGENSSGQVCDAPRH